MAVVVRRGGVRSSLGQTTAREGPSKSRCARGRQAEKPRVEKTGGQQGSPAPHIPRARTVVLGTSPHQARMGSWGRGQRRVAHPPKEVAVQEKVDLNVGVDVSKEKLDVSIRPLEKRFTVSNDPAGHAKLVEQLRGRPIARVVLEARAATRPPRPWL